MTKNHWTRAEIVSQLKSLSTQTGSKGLHVLVADEADDWVVANTNGDEYYRIQDAAGNIPAAMRTARPAKRREMLARMADAIAGR